jgi:hypothetical protein
VTAAALLWWFVFFGRVAIFLQIKTEDVYLDALNCILATTKLCQAAYTAAEIGGVTPYSPALLWTAIVLWILGLVYSLGAANARPRKEPSIWGDD